MRNFTGVNKKKTENLRLFSLSLGITLTWKILYGWGARIRTWECRNQNPVPYHLATPQTWDFLSKNSEGVKQKENPTSTASRAWAAPARLQEGTASRPRKSTRREGD